MLSNNLPADSIHSGFLHSHVHCLGQYRDNLCRTNLCTIEYNSVQNLPSLVSPLFVTMSNQGVGDYEILIVTVPYTMNTDYMFVRHRDSKDKKILFVRCRAYVSVSYSKHYQFVSTKTFYGSFSKNFVYLYILLAHSLWEYIKKYKLHQERFANFKQTPIRFFAFLPFFKSIMLNYIYALLNEQIHKLFKCLF